MMKITDSLKVILSDLLNGEKFTETPHPLSPDTLRKLNTDQHVGIVSELGQQLVATSSASFAESRALLAESEVAARISKVGGLPNTPVDPNTLIFRSKVLATQGDILKRLYDQEIYRQFPTVTDPEAQMEVREGFVVVFPKTTIATPLFDDPDGDKFPTLLLGAICDAFINPSDEVPCDAREINGEKETEIGVITDPTIQMLRRLNHDAVLEGRQMTRPDLEGRERTIWRDGLPHRDARLMNDRYKYLRQQIELVHDIYTALALEVNTYGYRYDRVAIRNGWKFVGWNDVKKPADKPTGALSYADMITSVMDLIPREFLARITSYLEKPLGDHTAILEMLLKTLEAYDRSNANTKRQPPPPE